MKIDEKLVSQAVRTVLEQKGMGMGGVNPTTSPVRVSINITLELADALMKRVESKAKELGMRVVTAVSDSHGSPVSVRCMDDAYVGSFDVALHKTFTAIAFKMSTEELGKLSGPDGPLYGIQHTNQGKIVIFGGGVPLRIGDSIVGAFGVSGGSAEQDTYLAHFAEEAFRELTGFNRKNL